MSVNILITFNENRYENIKCKLIYKQFFVEKICG